MFFLDVVLQDFCTIVGHENKAALIPHKRAWFRNVYTEAVGGLGQCNDTGDTLITKATECAALPADYRESDHTVEPTPAPTNALVADTPAPRGEESSAPGPKSIFALVAAALTML